MKKEGQVQISFGMIFSIIIIIATVVVAFYVISYFLNLSNSVSCKIFYNDLQERVNRAWNSDIVNDIYNPRIPGGVEYVCFGNLSRVPARIEYRDKYNVLKSYARTGNNLAFFPITSSCDDRVFTYKIEHVKDSDFFCVAGEKGKIKIKISKGSFDSLVSISNG